MATILLEFNNLNFKCHEQKNNLRSTRAQLPRRGYWNRNHFVSDHNTWDHFLQYLQC
jgi:hypothetical protein